MDAVRSQTPASNQQKPAALSNLKCQIPPLKQGAFKKLRPVSLTPRIHRGVGRGLCVLTLFKGFHRPANRFRAFLNSPALSNLKCQIPPLKAQCQSNKNRPAALVLLVLGLTLQNQPRKSNNKCLRFWAALTPSGACAAAWFRSCARTVTRRPNDCCKPSGSTSACCARNSRPWTANRCACFIRVFAAPRADRTSAARSFRSATSRHAPGMPAADRAFRPRRRARHWS